ncbi:unnamed protein product [Effrenium voratum]|nr:unnamed protein product [Effrenium voratum]CAJ1419760.1 unnamed protein product [Effrenium voratum]|mmetsp:Transcript_104152/g.247887  ORF Transcript_104152/g.247887 Transcript_104152/m.247887 type:complete len:101 (+) Transcript_104152:94-396(+)
MEAAPKPEFLPFPRLAKKDMHDAGLCVPCLFYRTKTDACRKGDACSHCHFCTKQEAKARRRALRAHGVTQKAQEASQEAQEEAKALLRYEQVLSKNLYWL